MRPEFGSQLWRSFAGAVLAGFIVLMPGVATAQQSDPPNEMPNTGQDVFEPPQNLFQVLYGYQTKPSSGAAPGSLATTTTETTNLRFDHRLDLSPQSLIVLRGDLPLVIKNPVSADDPSGNDLGGLGDADVQAIYAHNFDSRWAGGFGARLIAPTGGDTLGSGKWQIMPIAGFRYGMPDVISGSFLEPFARYDVSFAGDPVKRNISNLQLAPYLNLGLPDDWFVALFPTADIRVNFGDPVPGQTGRLFLPFDARAGRDLADHISLSLEIGVPIIKDYPVDNFKAQVRLNVTY